ncbi:hypothetical protein HKT18_09025 [Flavobacterium sp. IMCC34852]|uniref:PsbP C-terminal domain-containing protein n=1 Tax=Flavobacterium rivulicola TaxID=2732161 RepID=A0A7Y3R9F9_9FLAO|nr:hypothetical protein [Flavobacterium sp. IMCC34852]NNT72354.1 hypothetical protein [Flavobacterium sp. IMCC34852]
MKTLVLLLLSYTLYSQSPDLKIFKGQTYQISYSDEWKLDETGRNSTEFYLFYSPVVENFGNNINLLIQDLSGLNLDLDGYTDLSVKQIEAHGKILSSLRKTKNSIDYQELAFEVLYNNFAIKCFQFYFLKEAKAYVLTFTAEKNHYDNIIKEAQKVMESFVLP